jgi:hypothetical protein
MSFSSQAPPSSQPLLTPRPALFQRPSSSSASSPSGPSEFQVGDIHAEMTDYLRSISKESVIKRGNIHTTTGDKSKTPSGSSSSQGQTQSSFSLTDTQVEVLGRCSSGLLLVKARSCLWLFNPQRAEEAAKVTTGLPNPKRIFLLLFSPLILLSSFFSHLMSLSTSYLTSILLLFPVLRHGSKSNPPKSTFERSNPTR